MANLFSQLDDQKSGRTMYPFINKSKAKDDLQNEIEKILVIMRSARSPSESNNIKKLLKKDDDIIIKKNTGINHQDIEYEFERKLVLLRSKLFSSDNNNLYMDIEKLHRRADHITTKKNAGVNHQDLVKEVKGALGVMRSACLYDLDMDTKKLTRRVDQLIIKKNTCCHPSFKKRICMACGLEANSKNTCASVIYDFSVPFRYIDKDLRYNRGEIARLKEQNTRNMLSQRKLHLVLDLDHTLLHSISPCKLNENEKYLWKKVWENDNAIGELSYVSCIQMLVKTRPYVHWFLEKVSTMFEMYIYTMASSDYAKEMSHILDPQGVYFGSRIVSREDCTQPGKKSLDVILGRENATLILDDTKEVWSGYIGNLIAIKRYFYFAAGLSEYNEDKVQSSAEMKRSGGSEGDTVLSNVLEILKKVHTRFFEEHDERKTLETDVRDVLERVLRVVY